eukprot:scaffold265269_cov30-Tisochrysis_lutea.AAC.2
MSPTAGCRGAALRHPHVLHVAACCTIGATLAHARIVAGFAARRTTAPQDVRCKWLACSWRHEVAEPM